MKRAKDLYPKLVMMDNLLLAWYKAKKGKWNKTYVKEFSKDLNKSLGSLQDDLITGAITIGDYDRFTIFEPKKRVICAAVFRDRVLHHAMMNVCAPRIESNLIDQTCACRKNKGVDYAINIAKSYDFEWFLKLDVVKYFDSINHTLLMGAIERLFKEYPLIELFWKIVDSYFTRIGFGIPIGNLTSQFLANLFLSVLDHLIKEGLKIKGYVRYMDDMLLLSDNKDQLKEAYKKILDFCNSKLLLDLHEPIINRCKHGFPFLGYKINHWNIRLTQRSKKRFRHKYSLALKLLNGGFWTVREFEMHTEPLLAFLERMESINFVNSISLASHN